jgi:hypothetical protein
MRIGYARTTVLIIKRFTCYTQPINRMPGEIKEMENINYYRLSICLITTILLLITLPLHLPYLYYEFLRIVIFLGALYLLYDQYDSDKSLSVWIILLAFLAIAFNPIIPIQLTRKMWGYSNIICSVFYIVYFVANYKKVN